jgi:hypothetical protein
VTRPSHSSRDRIHRRDNLLVLSRKIWNQTSYSNACSTSLLIARAAEQIEEVRSKDTDGKSPLPQYLAKATISLAGDNKIEIEDSDTRTKNNNRSVSLLLTT